MNIGYKRFTQSQISLFSSFLLKKQRDRLVTRTVDTFPLVHKIIKKKQQDIFFHNLSLRLACMIRLTIASVQVLDPQTAITYPYGYRGLDSEDEDLIVTMVELMDEDDQ